MGFSNNFRNVKLTSPEFTVSTDETFWHLTQETLSLLKGHSKLDTYCWIGLNATWEWVFTDYRGIVNG